MPENPLHASAREQAALVRSGELSARELVEAALAAVDELNGELNAVVTRADERALAEADAIERGDERPLAGVPVLLKDILALAEGLRMTFGSNAMGEWVAPVDGNVARRLRGAGAIVIGKTNLPELGIQPVTEPDRFGPARNPWDTSRTTGGSSGGSAAAVAAGIVALAHGNDGGGSIRIPASCCGLVGLKPQRGRISHAPVPNEPAAIVVEGALSRTVADTALALDVLAGPEPGDPFWVAPPARPFAEAAAGAPERPLRIGFTTEAPNGVDVHADCVAAVESAAELLASLGHEVEQAAPDWRDDGFAGAFLKVWIAEVASTVPLLGLLSGRELDDDSLEPLTRRMVETARDVPASDYVSALGYLRMMTRRMAEFWSDRDVLLTPTLAQPPLEIGALRPAAGEDPLVMLRKAGEFVPFTPPFNVSGQPALSLPLHWSDDGLPIGIQLVGPAAGEGLLLSLAGQLEQARPWAERRPPVSTGAGAGRAA